MPYEFRENLLFLRKCAENGFSNYLDKVGVGVLIWQLRWPKTKIRKYAQPLRRRAEQNPDVPLVVLVLYVRGFCLKLSKDTL